MSYFFSIHPSSNWFIQVYCSDRQSIFLFFLAHLPLLEFFAHVIAFNALLKELVYAGGLIYLLEVITTSEVPEVRRGAVDLLSRCLANAQLGRRIQALLGQFLPAIFPETIKDTPEQFISLYDCEFLSFFSD